MSEIRAYTSIHVARVLDRYLADNFRTPLEDILVGVKALETELLQNCQSPKLRTEIRRRCAELYCSQCLERRAGWALGEASLQNLDNLGFSNVERRAHFAILLGQYAEDVPEARAAAKSRATDALRRVRCLSRQSSFRTYIEGLLVPIAEYESAT